MFLCYMDESGVSSISGNTTHFVLAGLAIPIWRWKKCEEEIRHLAAKYDLAHSEIHTAWMLRPYLAQSNIENFENLDAHERRNKVLKLRSEALYTLQKNKKTKLCKQTKKNYTKTEPYIHLTLQERQNFLQELAKLISSWTEARLFAECIDKQHFCFEKAKRSIDEQAFSQVISRFEQYLQIREKAVKSPQFGLLIHDHNDTVAKRHTALMKQFHQRGTLWTKVKKIVETPLFVNSELTSMIQVADLCAYALRRYVENGETALFRHVYKRADSKGSKVVGVRHFTKQDCICEICSNH